MKVNNRKLQLDYPTALRSHCCGDRCDRRGQPMRVDVATHPAAIVIVQLLKGS
jgi:hypothetical protein